VIDKNPNHSDMHYSNNKDPNIDMAHGSTQNAVKKSQNAIEFRAEIYLKDIFDDSKFIEAYFKSMSASDQTDNNLKG
jgi:hypothetical protein